MDVPRHFACYVPMPHAIRQHNPRNIVAARKNSRKVPAPLRARRYGDHIRFQPRQFQRAMRPLVPRPQFHAPKRPRRRCRTYKSIRCYLLKLHNNIDARTRQIATSAPLPPHKSTSKFTRSITRIGVSPEACGRPIHAGPVGQESQSISYSPFPHFTGCGQEGWSLCWSSSRTLGVIQTSLPPSPWIVSIT